ncbi:hypothetical protein GOODEAATRI_022031 [Goodea atripinnis]|uniref:Uncharacterized protein n=1 Tax=Goodea atripinnis TaxID=208336 RepID=A0ABV0N3E2_9TELE
MTQTETPSRGSVTSEGLATRAPELVTKIEQYQGLRALRLGGNTVGVEAAKAIAKALCSKDQLQRCYWSDMFTGRLRSEIPTALALRLLRNVQVINFGDCLVRSEGAIALAAVLREGLPILRELNLSFGEITGGAALVVAQAAMDKPHMEKVNLNGTITGNGTPPLVTI